MKTSNKLLLSGAFFVVLLFLVCSLYARQFIVKKEGSYLDGKDILGQKVLLEKYDTDSIYINNWYDYKLDPNSTSVTVEGDEEVLSEFGVKNYRGLYPFFNFNKDIDVNFSLPITFIIGVKGKSNLTIIAKDSPSIWSVGTLNIDNLIINAHDRANIEIKNEGRSIIVNAKNRSNIDLDGQINIGKFIVEGSSSIDAINMQFDSSTVNLSGTSLFRFKSSNFVTGLLEDRARLTTVDTIDFSGLKFFDKSKHKFE